MKLSDLFESTLSLQELMKLANEFKDEFDSSKGREEWGAPLSAIEAENGACSIVSETFLKWLKARGIASKLITGEIAVDRKWSEIPKEPGEPDAHTAVQVGSHVIDLTARQFNKSFPNPRITEVSDFNKEWEQVSN